MSRRVPQYLHCTLCHHTWLGMWLPLTQQQIATIMAAAHCPMCASDSSYIEQHNKPTPPDLSCSDLAVRVVVTMAVESDLAADMRLFSGLVQLGDPMSSCKHPRTMVFLLDTAKQIEHAAGQVRQAAARDLSRKESA